MKARSNLINLLIISCSVSLLATACTSNPTSYVVQGILPDSTYNGEMVYMVEYEKHDIRDSVQIVNGTFEFKGSIDTAAISRIYLQRLYTNIILENGKISVDLADPSSAKGTPLNDQLSRYLKKSEQLRESMIADRKAIADRKDIDKENRDDLFAQQYIRRVSLTDSLNSEFFTPNRNNALGTFVLWDWADVLSMDKMDSVYATAGDIVRNSVLITRIIENNKRKKQTMAGMPFVDFTIEDGHADGSKVSLSDYVGKGKYILVDFWASWCGPCIAETPIIAEVYRKYKGDKFDVLGIAVWDKREETIKAIAEHNIVWPQILNAGTVPTELYGIDGIPQIILFGPDGKIIERDLRGDRLKEKVNEVMRQI